MDRAIVPVAISPSGYQWDQRMSYRRLEQQSEESVGLGEVARTLWLHKSVVACAAAVGILAGLLPGIIETPVYRARTSLQLEGFNENYLNMRDITPVSPVVANASAEAYLQNQLKILQSETLARRVATKIDPHGEKWAPHSPGLLSSLAVRLGLSAQRPMTAEQDRVQRIRKAMTVRSSLQSQVLEVYFDSTDPVLAAQIANTIANDYITMNREARWQVVRDTTEWLSPQIADLKTKLEKSSEELQNYARQSGIQFTANQGTLAEEKMRQVQEALTRAQSGRAAKQSEYETAQSSAPEALPEILDNPQLREYQASLAAMRRDLAQLSTVYTPSHYKVQQLTAQVNDLQNTIARTREHVLDRIRNEFGTSQRLETLLANEYTRQARMVQSQTERQAHYNMLKREIDTTQQLYDSMVQKVKEAGVASALRATNIRVIDPANPPLTPYSPTTSLNCGIGLAVGLFFGGGLVLVRQQSDRSLRHPGDARLLNLRELGVIPPAHLDPTLRGHVGPLPLRRHSGAPLELVTWHHGPSLLAESFRGALASILFAPPDTSPPGVLVFTSVDSMEGKTTVLSNIGIAFAETGQSALLIDADLRRPRLHKIFNVCNDRGLTDLLSGQTPIASPALDLTRRTEIPGLDILTSGPGVARVTNLLYSSRLAELLEHLRKTYDIILIDTPPMGAFSDARVLGRQADAVVLVVRSGKTSREQIRSSSLQFMEDHTHVHGAIINDCEGRNPALYGSYTKQRYDRTI